MQVIIPAPLHSYTRKRLVAAEGATLRDLLLDLDRQYRGIMFRIVDEQDAIRPHIRIFVNGGQVFDLGGALAERDEVQIVQALSGG
jgi:sulfur-carrier protein